MDVHKVFFAELLTGKNALLEAMLAFNAVSRPAEGPPEVSGLAPEQVATLWRRPCVRAAFPPARPALASFWDFAEESRCLALLNQAGLDRLAGLFGAAVHAGAIAEVIVRDEVLALKRELGADLYAYALGRGRFAAGSIAELFAGRDRRLPLARRALRHGREALAVIRRAWPEALRARTRTLFTVPEGKMDGRVPDLVGVRDAVWFGLKKILLKEVVPQWAPCFS